LTKTSVGDNEQEIPMRTAIALAITLGAFALSPVVAASAEPVEPVPHHHHHHKHHHAVEHAPNTVAHPAPGVEAPADVTPGFKPYPPGEGDTDGLSRDPDDCDKGCIGGNPG
jgi:hypothetical protein